MQLHSKIEVSVPADRAWEVIADEFGNFGQITTALESSSLKGELGVGAIRVCNSKPVGPFPASVIEERLVEFDPVQKKYTYIAHSGLPAMFIKAQNTWSIESVTDTSCVIHSLAKLELKVWLRPLSGVLLWLIKRDLKKVFKELEYYIEYGNIHPRKANLNEPVNI